MLNHGILHVNVVALVDVVELLHPSGLDYEKTGEEKYKEYIERMKDDLMGLSRTAEGSLCEEGRCV